MKYFVPTGARAASGWDDIQQAACCITHHPDDWDKMVGFNIPAGRSERNQTGK